MRTTRSIPAAVAALAISATATFAALGPAVAADRGLDRAAEAAGKAVPARPVAAPAPEVVLPVPAEDPDDTADRPVTHGTTVSAAAKGVTPAGFDNHGAYVSSVARDNHGQVTSAEARPDTAGEPDTAGKPAAPGGRERAGRP